MGPAAHFDAQESGGAHWQGRLAIRLATTPVQSFSAGFELQGTAKAGSMALTTPLGTTVARLSWDASRAVLDNGSTQQAYASLEELTAAATGTDLPLDAIFGWLQGRDANPAGWSVDLSQREAGRLLARRTAPLPAVELKILLDQ